MSTDYFTVYVWVFKLLDFYALQKLAGLPLSADKSDFFQRHMNILKFKKLYRMFRSNWACLCFNSIDTAPVILLLNIEYNFVRMDFFRRIQTVLFEANLVATNRQTERQLTNMILHDNKQSFSFQVDSKWNFLNVIKSLRYSAKSCKM